VPTGLPTEHSQHDLDRISGERSREDEALQRHKKPSSGSDSSAVAVAVMRGLTRTMAMFGALIMAVWVSYRVGEAWFAFVLIAAIFTVSAMLAERGAERR
jgi:hypothetical protein